ncbi:MAG: hypothetical protein M1474_03440 [Candidatus Marsarchaeota archaeon]|jgi:hypothetical protein|nr:hypothetical protein [Candidatus Marsarchaeota archaeon]
MSAETKEQALDALDGAATRFNWQFYRTMTKTPDMAHMAYAEKKAVIGMWRNAARTYISTYASME